MSVAAVRVRGLIAALALLAGCATTAPRGTPPPEAAVAPAAESIVAAEAAPSHPLEPAAVDESPWARLRTRFALSGCAGGDEVMREARTYTRAPQRFAASWQRALPFLLLVLAEIEKRDLPGEFALLPYVESGYRPLPAQGNRPAGMWQLMPATARELGLEVNRRHDRRLDATDSTRAALDLIERLERKFGDWRLATMAFNTGEFRVERALGKVAGGDLDAATLRGLGFSPITHDHLARMLALACIVAEPERFGVEFPLPSEADILVEEPLDGEFDLRVAAAFADLPLETMLRYNAAHRSLRSSAGAPARLLLPVSHLQRLRAARSAHPELLALHWHARRTTAAASLAELAAANGLDAAALARANAREVDARLEAGSELLLPGPPALADADAVADADALHVVRPGDTLSALARRYGVRLVELLGWNTLKANTLLRPGMRLRVRAP